MCDYKSIAPEIIECKTKLLSSSFLTLLHSFSRDLQKYSDIDNWEDVKKLVGRVVAHVSFYFVSPCAKLIVRESCLFAVFLLLKIYENRAIRYYRKEVWEV